MAIESMTATVTVKAQALTNEKKTPYWKMDLRPDGADTAQTWTMFAHDVAFEKGTPINVGERWEFGVEESPKDGGGTWRNIKGVVRKLEDATPQSVAKAKATPSESTGRDLHIRAQVAVKGAIDWGAARLASGGECSTADVLKLAEVFMRKIGELVDGQMPQETAPDAPEDAHEPAYEGEADAVENERLYT